MRGVCETDLRRRRADGLVCGCRKTSGEIEPAFPMLSECESLFCISFYGAGSSCAYRRNFGKLCKLAGGNRLAAVDSSQLNPEIIKDFLTKGSSSEIQEFVQGYLGGMSKALESRMFRDYVVLHIRFTTIMYLESIGVEKVLYRTDRGKISGYQYQGITGGRVLCGHSSECY